MTAKMAISASKNISEDTFESPISKYRLVQQIESQTIFYKLGIKMMYHLL